MTENHMLEFLSKNTKEPFFMFIPTIGAHPAYRGHGDPETAPNPSGPCFKEGDPGFFSMYNNCTSSIYDWRDVKEKAPLRPPISSLNHSYPMYRREDGIVHYHDLDREPLATEDEAFWYRLNSVRNPNHDIWMWRSNWRLFAGIPGYGSPSGHRARRPPRSDRQQYKCTGSQGTNGLLRLLRWVSSRLSGACQAYGLIS